MHEARRVIALNECYWVKWYLLLSKVKDLWTNTVCWLREYNSQPTVVTTSSMKISMIQMNSDFSSITLENIFALNFSSLAFISNLSWFIFVVSCKTKIWNRGLYIKSSSNCPRMNILNKQFVRYMFSYFGTNKISSFYRNVQTKLMKRQTGSNELNATHLLGSEFAMASSLTLNKLQSN